MSNFIKFLEQIYSESQFKELSDAALAQQKELGIRPLKELILSDKPVAQEEVIAAMLLEPTPTSILDSGGDSGRHWQKNQGRNFEEEPAFDYRVYQSSNREDVWMEFSTNIYHLLKQMTYLPDITKAFYQWVFEQEDGEAYTNSTYSVKKFLEETDFDCHIEFHDNTYNWGDGTLSQTLQIIGAEYKSEQVLAVSVHGGADVRGGYGTVVFFQEPDEYYLIRSAQDVGADCTHCDCNWYSDDAGYNFYSNQNEYDLVINHEWALKQGARTMGGLYHVLYKIIRNNELSTWSDVHHIEYANSLVAQKIPLKQIGVTYLGVNSDYTGKDTWVASVMEPFEPGQFFDRDGQTGVTGYLYEQYLKLKESGQLEHDPGHHSYSLRRHVGTTKRSYSALMWEPVYDYDFDNLKEFPFDIMVEAVQHKDHPEYIIYKSKRTGRFVSWREAMIAKLNAVDSRFARIMDPIPRNFEFTVTVKVQDLNKYPLGEFFIPYAEQHSRFVSDGDIICPVCRMGKIKFSNYAVEYGE